MRSQDIYFIGKRYYTNRDALREKYGRTYQLPSHWVGLGAKVRLWLIDYHKAEYCSESVAGLDVISLPLRRTQGWAGLLSLTFRVVFHKPAVVVASGDCYIGLLIWVLSRLSGCKFVFDVYDKYDEFPGYRRVFGFDIFGFLLKRSDLILFASQTLLSSLGSSVRGDFVVPNGIDLEHIYPMDKQRAREVVDLPSGPMLVGYFGSMESDRGVDDLIQAIHLLRTKNENVFLVLGGKLRKGLRVDVDGIIYVGNVPYEKILFYLSSCDVLSIPYRRSEFMDAGSSNKIAESIAARRPIVVTRTPNFLHNFPGMESYLGSAICECSNPESLANAILQQLKRPVLLDLPDDMDWSSIACRTLWKIKQNFKQEKIFNDFQ